MLYRNKYIKSAKFSNLKKEISDRQFAILCILAYSKKNTVSELAKLMQISKSTISIIMSKMLKKGYLIKTYPNECDDKRRIYFSISKKGECLLKDIQKKNFDESKYIFSLMNEYQKSCMLNAWQHLADALDDNDKELLSVLSFAPDNADPLEQMLHNQALFLLALIRKINLIIRDDMRIDVLGGFLTKNQCHLLICIEKYKYNTISRLENFLNSSGSTVSITVSKLVKSGYVIKESPAENEDGRIVYIKLTPKGREVIKKMQQIMKTIFLNYVISLNEKSIVSIEKGIDLLLMAFDNDM